MTRSEYIRALGEMGLDGLPDALIAEFELRLAVLPRAP